MSFVMGCTPICISPAFDGEGEEGAPVSLMCQHPAFVQLPGSLKERATHPRL